MLATPPTVPTSAPVPRLASADSTPRPRVAASPAGRLVPPGACPSDRLVALGIVPPARPGVANAYKGLGYQILYLTTAPEEITVAERPIRDSILDWLLANGFPIATTPACGSGTARTRRCAASPPIGTASMTTGVSPVPNDDMAAPTPPPSPPNPPSARRPDLAGPPGP